MKIVNIHDAKSNLSKLLEGAERGESFIIARAGKPIAKVLKLDAQPTPKRIGFMRGRGRIPDDFDTMLQDEIADAFEGRVDRR